MMCEEDSVFLDADPSTFSIETPALAEIIIAAVKHAVDRIENVVAELINEISDLLLR